MALYTLEVTPSILSVGSSADLGNVAGSAKRWRRSIRDNGGFWQGSFFLEDDPRLMTTIFDSALGSHVTESELGLTTWEGFVSELRLESPAGNAIRSLNLMTNAVAANYDLAGTSTFTGFTADDISIQANGRREEILRKERESLVIANAYIDTQLQRKAHPYPRRTSLTRRKGQARLFFTVQGYIATVNWRYIDPASFVGLPITYDAAVRLALTFADYMTAGTLITNPLTVTVAPDRDRAWDYISDLTENGDGTGVQWKAWTDTNRLFNYAPIDTSPRYIDTFDGLYDVNGNKAEVSPRRARPGVWRDESYTLTSGRPEFWLEDARDAYVPEVEVDERGRLIAKTDEIPEGDILTGQARLTLPSEDLVNEEVG